MSENTYKATIDYAGNGYLVGRSPSGHAQVIETKGEGRGNIYVSVQQGPKRKIFLFSQYEDVEYPSEDHSKIGGYTKLKRKTLTILIDSSKGRPKSIFVNGY